LVGLGKLYSELEAIKSPAMVSSSADALDDSTVENMSKVFVSPISSTGWCWIEIFEPLLPILQSLTKTNPEIEKDVVAFREYRDTVLRYRSDHAHRFGSTTRVPLQWQKKKPTALRQLTPRFEEHFNPDRRYEVDPDTAARKKLKALHRREFKGAVRELKKDAKFLAVEKIRAQKQADKEYQVKIRKVMGSLASERGEANAEMRSAGKRRR
jgi:nucleolar protein 14